MFYGRKNAEIFPMVILVIAVYVVNLRPLKQFTNKGLRHKTMNQE